SGRRPPREHPARAVLPVLVQARDEAELRVRGLADLQIAALVAQPLEIGDVGRARHLPDQDLADVPVRGEGLEQLGVADLLRRLLPDEEVAVALQHFDERLVLVVWAVAQRLDLVEQVVVLQGEPSPGASHRGEGVHGPAPLGVVVFHVLAQAISAARRRKLPSAASSASCAPGARRPKMKPKSCPPRADDRTHLTGAGSRKCVTRPPTRISIVTGVPLPGGSASQWIRPPRRERSVRYAARRVRLRPFAMRQGTTKGTILSVR